MPNHWHLVLWPHADGDLSRLLAWLSNTQQDEHLLTVLRYVEANPLRARLAQRAGEWPWSSDALRNGPFASLRTRKRDSSEFTGEKGAKHD